MAYLSERIEERTLAIIDGEFVNNARFSYKRTVRHEDFNTERECITVTYEIKYGNGKTFKIVNVEYPYYNTVKLRPIIMSDMSEAKIDADIKRLHDLLK